MTSIDSDATEAAPFVTFDNSYARLPERFFVRQAPQAWPEPRLLAFNEPLAELLGADAQALRSAEGVAFLSGGSVAQGSEPLAMAYAGHQFGGFSPQLGDGRALLLGEVVGQDGVRRDIQLKGSGPTPFSRMGDGKAAIGPVLREYLIAEAMAALGAPTTRALAALATGDRVIREHVLPGAVLVRVAASHVRVGTFQYFAAREDEEALRLLADYVIERHYPHLTEAQARYPALLRAVIDAQAELVAQWMAIGFIHGVMNTDNMSIAAETIDYGPCAFMDAYHPNTVFSSIDHGGRYAYANQPRVAPWNLARLAEAMLPLLGADRDAQIAQAQAAIDTWAERFESAYLALFRRKFGFTEARPDDAAAITSLLTHMTNGEADFTNTFRGLRHDEASARAAFRAPDHAEAFMAAWRAHLGGREPDRAAMNAANPAIIPRNHHVERALDAATADGDLAPFWDLHAALSAPYEDRAADDPYRQPPAPNEVVRATFCGT